MIASMLEELAKVGPDLFNIIVGVFIVAVVYGGIAAISGAIYGAINRNPKPKDALTARKTVTFGDESAVRANRVASVLSVITIFVLWGAFTGSKYLPIHVPAPYEGTSQFTYTVRDAGGAEATANVTVPVIPRGTPNPKAPETAAGALAVDDFKSTNVRIPTSVRALRNDEGGKEALDIVAVDGKPIATDGTVRVPGGEVVLTKQERLFFKPDLGWQMDPIYLPPPERVVARLVETTTEGYRGYTLQGHVAYSLFRVVTGFLLGVLVGVPLGFAMGLGDWARGWFDPIVEFMRPVPPLALIPLIIIWFGITEEGKIVLLFLAALWIMTIAARAGVSGVAIQKVHAAYSLGATRWQILTRVIFPNALPEIFTGARVAMGVCWGTVVAAELVAGAQGAGMMIMVASKFQLTDIVILGIIVIGIVGYLIDIGLRWLEARFVPWKGRV